MKKDKWIASIILTVAIGLACFACWHAGYNNRMSEELAWFLLLTATRVEATPGARDALAAVEAAYEVSTPSPQAPPTFTFVHPVRENQWIAGAGVFAIAPFQGEPIEVRCLSPERSSN